MFVYVKAMNFLYIIPVKYNGPPWKNSKLPFCDGLIKPRDYEVSEHLRTIWEHGVKKLERLRSRRSEYQIAKTSKYVIDNPEKFYNSGLFPAWERDMQGYGD